MPWWNWWKEEKIEIKPLIEEISARLKASLGSSAANQPTPSQGGSPPIYAEVAEALVMTAEAVAEKGNVPIRDAVERMYRDYNAGLIYVGINYDGTHSEFKVSGDEEEVMRWSDNTKDHSIVSWYDDGELKLKVAVRRPSKRAGSQAGGSTPL